MATKDDPADPVYILSLLSKEVKPSIWSEWLEPGRRFCENGDYDRARQSLAAAIEQAEEIALTARESGDRIKASALMCFGVLALGHPERVEHPGHARDYFRRAERIYALTGEHYGQAISLLVQARLAHKGREWRGTPMLYQESLNSLRRHNGDEGIITRLCDNIQVWQRLAIEGFEESVGSTANKGPGDPKPTGGTSSATRKERPLLQIVRLYQDVSAGPGIWDDPDEKEDEFLEVDQMMIGNKQYEIKPIGAGTSRVLRLYRDSEYGICRVEGDSMKDADIKNNDYVLFSKERGQPPKAEDGDIVVAAIDVGGSPKGVVKRYRENQNGAWLESENKDASTPMPPRPFQATDRGVVGKVITILKHTPVEA